MKKKIIDNLILKILKEKHILSIKEIFNLILKKWFSLKYSYIQKKLQRLVKEEKIRRHKKWVYWELRIYYWDMENYKLVNDSYLTAETALSMYHIIPEWVFLDISAVKKKTKTIKWYETDRNRFIQIPLFDLKHAKLYKPKWKTGNNYQSRIASKERAIFDWLWYNKEQIIDDWRIEQWWDQWYRFDCLEKVNEEWILDMCYKSKDKKMIKYWEVLYKYIKWYKEEDSRSWTEIKHFKKWDNELNFDF